MDELTIQMDSILMAIDKNRWISFSKDDDDLMFKSKDKLRAFGLIEPHGKLSWQLTEEGYNAVTLGGFIAWQKCHETNKVNGGKAVSIDNISFISGNDNQVNQSRLEKYRDTNIKQTTKPQNHPTPKATKSMGQSVWLFVVKFWWTAIIPFIIAIIILSIDKGWFR